MCGGSQRAGLTRGVVGERLLHEAVQLAGRRVPLDLLIPFGPVLFEEPVPQLRELIRVELRDLLLEMFESRHICHVNKVTGMCLPPSNGPRFSCAGPPGQCTALAIGATRAGVGCKRLLDDDGAIRRMPRLTARQSRQAYKIGSCSCPAAEIVNSRHDTFGASGVAGRNPRNPPTRNHARVVACPSSRRASYATIVLTCPRASPSNS